MEITAVVQSRVGSTRLPGKMMYPLAGEHVVKRVLERVELASEIDETVLAIPNTPPNDVIESRSAETGTTVYRGDEEDVLSRTLDAAAHVNSDVIVRIAGDCPLVPPSVIDACVSKLRVTGVEYVSNKIQRTFPLGFDVEVFTYDSFERVDERATAKGDREHVTTYYRNNPEEFSLATLTADEVVADDRYQNRTEIELVLDKPVDYELLHELYPSLSSPTAGIKEIIDTVDNGDLLTLNSSVRRTEDEQ